MQLESFLLKGRPFPIENAVTAIPFLAELETQSLSGTHDVDFVRGAVRLFAGTEKAPFPGMRGGFIHVPCIPEQAARAEKPVPSLPLPEIVRGLEAALSVLAELR